MAEIQKGLRCFRKRKMTPPDRGGNDKKQKTDAESIGLLKWERVDLNHRSETQQIYSLPPLATRELSHLIKLVDGLEPPTC